MTKEKTKIISNSDNPRKICVITGTTNGIGFETAKLMALDGFSVYTLNRNPERAEVATRQLKKQTNREILSIQCDLANLNSIKKATTKILQSTDRVDVLINNAGIMTGKHELSPQGYELTFAVNQIGPFFLTQLLTQSLLKYEGSRIVNIASSAHQFGNLNLEELHLYKSMQSTYSRSKLANVLWTLKLAREHQNNSLTINCMHPGVVATNLLPQSRPLFKALGKMASSFMMSPQDSAKTVHYVATAKHLKEVSGKYFNAKGKQISPSNKARNTKHQDSLWERSLKIVSRNLEDER